MQLYLHPFALPLRHTFRISTGEVSVQETLIVELRDGGISGFGEATVSGTFGITMASMVDLLEANRGRIESSSFTDPAAWWADLDPVLQANRFAQCALDEAAHDLWGKRLGKPVYELWGLTLDRIPHSNFTIGIDTVEVMVAKLKEMPDWPIYKIKLGTDRDLGIIRELRRHTSAPFRVDANTDWSGDELLRNAPQLCDLGVEFIEQPLKRDQWEEMRRVKPLSALPLMADESCQMESDVEKCQGAYHGINIKLVKCGGLTPARRMIAHARKLGLRVMCGCMTESTVGISAIAQLLPLLDDVDLDGAALLAKDCADGVKVERGIAKFPQRAGTGVELRP